MSRPPRQRRPIMPHHPADADQRANAALALALADATPPEAPPDLAEIERWRHGALSPARAAAVRARLARDPAAFAQLVELETAADLARQLAPAAAPVNPGFLSRLLSGRRLLAAPWAWGGGLATLALAAGIGFIVLPQLGQLPRAPDLAHTPAGREQQAGLRAAVERDLAHLDGAGGDTDLQPATSSQAAATDADARQAFRDGVRLAQLAAGSGRVGKGLDLAAGRRPDCPADERACRARRDAYQRLGRWAWELDADCAPTAARTPDWAAAARTLTRLAADLAAQSGEPLAATLAAAAQAEDPRRLCATAARLLAIGAGE